MLILMFQQVVDFLMGTRVREVQWASPTLQSWLCDLLDIPKDV